MHNYAYLLKIYIDEHITAYTFINNFDFFYYNSFVIHLFKKNNSINR